jgi:hypothetical protein
MPSVPALSAFVAAVYSVAGPRPELIAVAQALLDAATAVATARSPQSWRRGQRCAPRHSRWTRRRSRAPDAGQIATRTRVHRTALAFLVTLAALAFLPVGEATARTPRRPPARARLSDLCKPIPRRCPCFRARRRLDRVAQHAVQPIACACRMRAVAWR